MHSRHVPKSSTTCSTSPNPCSSPIRDSDIVVGKFLAALTFLAFMLVISVYMPILVMVNGKITLSGPGQLRALNGDLVPGIGTTILPYTVAIQTFGGKGIGHWTLDVPFFAPVAICSELLTSGRLVMATAGRREELDSD